MFSNVERKMVRAISLVLAVLLIVALIPAGTFISGAIDEKYTVTLKNAPDKTVQLDGVKITLKNKTDEKDTKEARTEKGVALFGQLAAGTTYSVSVDELKGYTLETKEFTASDSNKSDITIKEMDKVSVSGIVKDNEDNPYEDATIHFSGYTEGKTTTDSDGKYSFDVYKGQDYKVKSAPKSDDSAKYAETAEKSIDTSSNSTENFKFELKEYSISVSGSNGENGTIVANPSSVQYGGSSTITVTPKTENGYELTSVKDNDNEKLSAATSEPFSFDIENVQGEHTVEAAFALKKYTVSINCGTGGTASTVGDSSTVEHGKDAKIIIKPEKGYDVNSVKCGENNLDVKEVEDSNIGYYTIISDVKSDIAVDVSFSASLKGNGDEYTFNSKIARAEEKTYYYGKDENGNPEKAVFTAASGYKGIELIFSDGGSKGSRSKNVVEIDKTKTIKDIVVYESIGNKSKTISDVNINIVVDTASPTVKTANADPATWTNGSVKIKGTADDPDDSEEDTQSYYYLMGDFNSWKESDRMTDEGESMVAYNISLSAGTYEFKIKNGSAWYGNNGTIDNTTEKTSEIGWLMESDKDNCKLEANGGWYRFSFNTATKFLIVTKLDSEPTNNVSNASGVYEVKLMDGETLVDTTKPNNDGSYSFEVSGEQDKTYQVVAVDKSGNESDAANVEVKIDKTAPVITGFEFDSLDTSDESGNYSNDDIEVKVTANDEAGTVHSGVNAVQLYMGEKEYGKPVSVDNNIATFTLKAEDFAQPTDISAKAIDNAGNESEMKKPSELSEDIKTDTFVISTTKATVGITDAKLKEASSYYENEDQHWYSDDAKFNVTVNTPDQNIPIKSIKVKIGDIDITSDIDGKAFVVGGLESKFSISTAQDGKKIENGENKITVTVTLKNGVKIDKSASLYIDTVKPRVTNFEIKRVDNGEESFSNLDFGYFHNNQIKVTVSASDADPSSGLSEIELYKGLDKESLLGTTDVIDGNATFLIPAEDITESDGEKVYFNDTLSAVVYDNVSNDNTDDNGNGQGITTQNSNIKNTNLMIETNKPLISMAKKGDNQYTDTENNKIWYSSDVEYNFTVNDKDSGIRSAIITINGKELINESYYKEKTKHTEETYTVNTSAATRNDDGSYKIVVTVVDNAGNEITKTDTIYKDDTNPEITGFNFKPVKYVENAEVPIVEITNYGFFFKEDTEVTISAEDNSPSSGIQKIVYYTYDTNKNKIVLNSEKITDENDKISIIIEKSFKGQIYARAVDNVENTPDFVHPDGAVVESETMHKNTSDIIYHLPDTDNEDSKGYDLYTKDTKVKVTIEDTYSGIKQLDWKVVSPYDDKNQAGVVKVDYDGKVTSESKDGKNINCLGKWNAKKQGKSNLVKKLSNTLTISNNSNNIKITFTLTDRAGNKSTKVQELSIDKDAPIIDVKYTDPSGEPKNEKYFTKRTATITVTERNFDADNVKIIAKGVDDNGNEFKVKDLNPSKFNKKGTLRRIKRDGVDIEYYVYSMRYTYSKNADYTFAISATDDAGNKTSDEKVKYNGLAPRKFTVDNIKPIVSVSYDNNNAANGKYFNAPRTATITVKEHNFDNSDVKVLVNGEETDDLDFGPKNSNERHSSIKFEDNGDYTFAVSVTDKAGNSITDADVQYVDSVAEHEFTIDKEAPHVKITSSSDNDEFKNGSVLDDGEKVKISIKDTNPGNYTIKLTRSRVLVAGESDNNENASLDDVKEELLKKGLENKADVTSEFLDVSPTGTGNVEAAISIPKRTDDVKNDGVYTLTVETEDLAANDYTDVKAEKTTDFSVNRFGSVYTFEDDLYSLITEKDGYTQKVTSDQLKIYEYNPDAVKKNKVEVISNNNSKTLTEKTDYSFVLDNKQKDTEWNRYVYTINPNNFKKDGAYTVRLSSTDEVGNDSQTLNYDVCKVKFFVDSTDPEISSVIYSSDVSKIALLDEGSAMAEKLDINFTVEDLIRLDRVEVYVDDIGDNAKPVKVYTYGKAKKGDASIFSDIHNFDFGKITLNNSADAHAIRIIARDKAGNSIDTVKGDFNPGYTYFGKITVTPNILVIWAKSPLFWIIIGAAVAAIGGITALIIVKKKKKAKVQ